MIDSLHIEGFQSLQHVDIELGTFTVLVGPTNSGKSAIRRAIEALINNDPPAGRLREGCPAYVVSMTLDGTWASIHKAKKGTTYQIGELLIDKPGQTCPEPVSEMLRLSDVNFASQFDAPFLLADTASAAARTLGELTNISVLFEGIREATRRQRAAGTKAKVHAEQVDVLANKLAVYADLPGEQDQLQRAHGALLVASETDGVAIWVSQQHAEAQRAVVAIQEGTMALTQQPDWDYVEGTVAAVDVVLGELHAIEGVIGRVNALVAQRDAAMAELAALPDAGHAKAVEITEIHVNRAAQLEAVFRQAMACKTTMDLAMNETKATVAEIAAEEELASIDVCPLCERAL